MSIEAHVVHVDMISQNGMGFKLTEHTIQALIACYDNVRSHRIIACISTCPPKKKAAQLQGLQQKFVKAVNSFVFCTHVSALESLASDGSGILRGDEEKATREAVDRLLVSIIPPSQEINASQGIIPLQEQGGSWPTD
ncbi:hypothetical protein N7486_001259 [Penicillium sp. IBT 16267x]|nr:hypothetical protein N7486_001259 [Penicillium sp. IBT 16267x]